MSGCSGISPKYAFTLSGPGLHMFGQLIHGALPDGVLCTGLVGDHGRISGP